MSDVKVTYATPEELAEINAGRARERERRDKEYAQALIDQADAEVRRIARKAGVPDHAMAQAMRDFARELVPHAGRQASVHSPRHWRQWWRGWVAGMFAMKNGEVLEASIELPDSSSLAADDARRQDP